MSRRLLLAAGGPSVEIPDPLPGDGGGGDPDPGDGLSAAWHGEHTASMQPEWDHVVRVGPSRTLNTLAQGLASARQTPYARLGIGVGNNRWSPGVRAGYARAVIVLDPGTYTAPVDGGMGPVIGGGIDLIGNGDTRDEVTITNAAHPYAVMPWLGFYLANLTLHQQQGPTGNNYAFHGSAMGASEQRNFTAILDNVAGLDTNTGSSGIFGWDMPPGTEAFLYRCRMESTTGHGIVFHEDGQDPNVDTLFLECEADVDLHVAATNGSTWVVNCTELDGTPIPNSAVVNGVTSTPPTGIPTTLPVDGMVASEAAKYAQPILGTGQEVVPAFPSTSNLSGFTPGRTYYVPLTLPRSVKVAGARLNIVTAAGTVAAGVFGGLTPGTGGWGYLSYGDATTATVGNVNRPIYADDADLWLPAGMQLWLAVRVNSGSAVVRASAGMAAAHQCYYSDDASTPTTGGINPFPSGVTPLPSGSAVPWVALITA